MSQGKFQRVIFVVLDGVGAGEAPDANDFGDQGSDTLGNLSRAFVKETGKPLRIPNLVQMGIDRITRLEASGEADKKPFAFGYGKCREQSAGKDTTSGHWEMAGMVISEPFKTFSDGFPRDVVDRWINENSLPGILGNKPASGTEIIKELGEEHVRTGKPILYTSADSVWQIAAHEEAFGLDRLYQISRSARKICDTLGVARVIARPFVGDSSADFKRTYNRKDYSQLPPCKSYLDFLLAENVPTKGVGKIANIYADQGVGSNIDTAGNTDGINVLLEQLDVFKKGLLFCNLIDFDMLYGHRRDVRGFGIALEEFDQALSQLLSKMNDNDLLMISADHGNDPTYRGTDHTREYVPVLTATRAASEETKEIGVRDTFADIGATFTDALTGRLPEGLAGSSFLERVC